MDSGAESDFSGLSKGKAIASRILAGFRNRLTHEYLSVDLDIVWNVIENYLPDLEKTIEAMAQEFWNVN